MGGHVLRKTTSRGLYMWTSLPITHTKKGVYFDFFFNQIQDPVQKFVGE
jgi:hypothetical protein